VTAARVSLRSLQHSLGLSKESRLRTTPRAPRTALTATGQPAADVSKGFVNLALGEDFLIVGQRADLMADLLSDQAKAKPWHQQALKDTRLALHRKGDESPSQLGGLGIVGSCWQVHGRTVPSWGTDVTERRAA
jgi:hypothetical protein